MKHMPHVSLITVIEIIAILVGAFSGFIEARRKRMDVVGVFTVAFIAAFGGGTLRDILLDRRPLFWVQHQEYAILIFILALIANPLIRTLRQIVSERLIVIADAVGLGLFAVAGVSLALTANMPLFIASMMGVITGIFGGVLRDIVCNEVPMVFRDGKPYAICAFIGCWLYILLQRTNVSDDFALWLSATVITVLRLLTWKFDMRVGRP
ncbi:trimeric intracellular cation channel family protein [Massilia sp. MB5]|uniref:trimeric intracellular cation channel family protein n=1 Tax=unclassified Massilia TaxID=2609279 RepID=UPI0009E49383|nr:MULTISPECIES: trimeric intracellular cation channel family protein [unclassified Massilia]NVE00586.1 trimeric intracellular cation channel family protein [Massilia sp. BJB1822]UMR28679.1 trimeric intracellular cation channel family protein [Massilia sp. MB5]